MTFDTLRETIAALERANELKRISVEVDPILEVTEIADRVMKSPGVGPRSFLNGFADQAYPC